MLTPLNSRTLGLTALRQGWAGCHLMRKWLHPGRHTVGARSGWRKEGAGEKTCSAVGTPVPCWPPLHTAEGGPCHLWWPVLTRRSGHRMGSAAGSRAARRSGAAAPAAPSGSGPSCHSGGSGWGQEGTRSGAAREADGSGEDRPAARSPAEGVEPPGGPRLTWSRPRHQTGARASMTADPTGPG